MMISAPRSVASSRYSRSRRFRSVDDADSAGVSTTTASSGARRMAAVAAARRRARGVAGDASTSDEDALADRLSQPRGPDVLELRIHASGDEAEGQLAQRGQVRLGEEAVEGDPRALLGVDVAVAHPLAERERTHVDELDLIGGGKDLVGDALVDGGPGDRRDSVGDRFEVLDVAGADHVDAGIKQDVHVLPALRPFRPRCVGMGKLVDERDGRRPGKDGVGVHLLDHDAPILDTPARHDLEPVEELLGLRSPVRLDEPDDEVGPALRPAVALLEHAVGLADARAPSRGRPAAGRVHARRSPPRAGEHLLGGRAGVLVAPGSGHAGAPAGHVHAVGIRS